MTVHEYAVEVEDMTPGEINVLREAGITILSFADGENGYPRRGTATFPSPGEALRAAAILADDPNWYPGARILARRAAQVIPTRLHLDSYPPRVQLIDGSGSTNEG